MAGHSHWAGIKHKKAVVDAKRAKLWSRLSKGIIIAANMGGGDPDANLRLRYAINDAKAVSMPKENIDRAIKKGTGELDGGQIDEVLYEGYGPCGVAVMCEIMTDNRNRTAPEIRKIFELADGKLGATGCVSWMFERKAMFLVSKEKCGEDQLMELALEAGADDVSDAGDSFQLTAEPDRFSEVSQALDTAGIEVLTREIVRLPKETVDLDATSARKVLKLMDKLDDHDDVQSVAANFNIPEEVLAEMEG